MLELVFNNSTEDKEFQDDFFKNIFNLAIEELKLGDKNIEVSINIVGEDKIRELNHQYRHKDKVTDVLSFPMQSFGRHRPGGAKRLEGPFDYVHPTSNVETFDVGDIFICLPFAKKEAKRENINIDVKLARLLAHGFLHLLGYDHEKSKLEEKKIFGLEKRILAKCLKTKD